MSNSEDRRAYNAKADSMYDKIGKSATKKLIEAAFPEFNNIPTTEKYKAGDLFYEDDNGDIVIFEAEARAESCWDGVWNKGWGVRIPNGKNPYNDPACKWDCYVQTGKNHEHQGVFFGRGALKNAVKKENVTYWEDGVKKKGTFVYPNPDDITFYEIRDGKAVEVTK